MFQVIIAFIIYCVEGAVDNDWIVNLLGILVSVNYVRRLITF
jgi:hypothetical protein